MNVHFAGMCLRVFWRKRSMFCGPYAFHNWGFYAFGVGPIGCMFWPRRSE